MITNNAPISANDDEIPEIPAAAVNSADAAAALKVFIVFYSTYGHVEKLVKRMKKGAEAVLFLVPETSGQSVGANEGSDKDSEITAAELATEDVVLFWFPTRYGYMAAQMKAFFDSTGQLWKEQSLVWKPAGFFLGTGTQGGGQETTA